MRCVSLFVITDLFLQNARNHTVPANQVLHTLQVCCVLVFWSVHHLLLRKLLTPSSLIGAMALSLLVLGLHRRLTLGSSLVKGFSTSLLFSIIGFALSPVLSKLTDSISTDTIHRYVLEVWFHSLINPTSDIT